MHRFIIEMHTPKQAREVLDWLKTEGGHGNLINVRPDLDDVQTPSYVNEPYPPEAYDLAEKYDQPVDPSTIPPDCPFCDGSGALSSRDDRERAVRERHPDWDDAKVHAEVARHDAELAAQGDRWDRERSRIRAQAAQG